MRLFWNYLGVIEVVEHKVTVFFNFRGQVGSIQVLVVFIDSDTDASCRNVTRSARSFRQFFRIMKLRTAAMKTPTSIAVLILHLMSWTIVTDGRI